MLSSTSVRTSSSEILPRATPGIPMTTRLGTPPSHSVSKMALAVAASTPPTPPETRMRNPPDASVMSGRTKSSVASSPRRHPPTCVSTGLKLNSSTHSRPLSVPSGLVRNSVMATCPVAVAATTALPSTAATS